MIDPFISTLHHEFRTEPAKPDFARLNGLLDAIALVNNLRQRSSFNIDGGWEILWAVSERLLEQFDADGDPQFTGVCAHCLQEISHNSQTWIHEGGDRNGATTCHRYGNNVATPVGKPEKPQYQGQERAA